MLADRLLHTFSHTPTTLAVGSTTTILDTADSLSFGDSAYLCIKATGGGQQLIAANSDKHLMFRVREFDNSANEFTYYFPAPGNAVGTYTIPLVNGSATKRCVVDVVNDDAASVQAKSSANQNQLKVVGSIRAGYRPLKFHIQCRHGGSFTTTGTEQVVGSVGIPGGTTGVASGACTTRSGAFGTTGSGGVFRSIGSHIAGHLAYGLTSWDFEGDSTLSTTATDAMDLQAWNSTNLPLQLAFLYSLAETDVKCWVSFDLYGGGA